MIKILYDFDINKINNCRFFDPHTGEITMLTHQFTSDVLKSGENLFDLQYLGGGYDSVCFVENINQSFYIVEPANGLLIAFQLMEGLIEFEEKRQKAKFDNHKFGAMMDETVFRPHRNDDEIMVIGEVENHQRIKDCKVVLKYPGSDYKWECSYVEFAVELLRFGERMIYLYDRLLPDFREYSLYPKLKTMLLEDNTLRQEYGHLMAFDNLGKSFMDYIGRELW